MMPLTLAVLQNQGYLTLCLSHPTGCLRKSYLVPSRCPGVVGTKVPCYVRLRGLAVRGKQSQALCPVGPPGLGRQAGGHLGWLWIPSLWAQGSCAGPGQAGSSTSPTRTVLRSGGPAETAAHLVVTSGGQTSDGAVRTLCVHGEGWQLHWPHIRGMEGGRTGLGKAGVTGFFPGSVPEGCRALWTFSISEPSDILSTYRI